MSALPSSSAAPQALEIWTGDTQAVVVHRTFVERLEDIQAQQAAPPRQHGSAPEVLCPEKMLMLRDFFASEGAAGTDEGPSSRRTSLKEVQEDSSLPSLLATQQAELMKVKYTFIHVPEDDKVEDQPNVRRHTWAVTRRDSEYSLLSTQTGGSTPSEGANIGSPMDFGATRRGSMASRLSVFSATGLSDMLEGNEAREADSSDDDDDSESEDDTPPEYRRASLLRPPAAYVAEASTEGGQADDGAFGYAEHRDSATTEVLREQLIDPEDDWPHDYRRGSLLQPPDFGEGSTDAGLADGAAFAYAGHRDSTTTEGLREQLIDPEAEGLAGLEGQQHHPAALYPPSGGCMRRGGPVQHQTAARPARRSQCSPAVPPGQFTQRSPALLRPLAPQLATAPPPQHAAPTPLVAAVPGRQEERRAAAAPPAAPAAPMHPNAPKRMPFPVNPPGWGAATATAPPPLWRGTPEWVFSSQTPGPAAAAGTAEAPPLRPRRASAAAPPAPGAAAASPPLHSGPPPAAARCGHAATPKPAAGGGAPGATEAPNASQPTQAEGSALGKTPKGGRSKRLRLWAHIYLHMQDVGEFDLVPRLIGRGGCNMRRIADQTGAKVRIRGRGSGHLEVEGKAEAPTPLMMAVTSDHKDDGGFKRAVELTLQVLKAVGKRFEAHCKKIKHRHEGPYYSVGLLPPNAKDILGSVLDGVPQSSLAIQAEQELLMQASA